MFRDPSMRHAIAVGVRSPVAETRGVMGYDVFKILWLQNLAQTISTETFPSNCQEFAIFNEAIPLGTFR